ncbi:Protein of unknown function, partial [Gryllus bimaculatus]
MLCEGDYPQNTTFYAGGACKLVPRRNVRRMLRVKGGCIERTPGGRKPIPANRRLSRPPAPPCLDRPGGRTCAATSSGRLDDLAEPPHRASKSRSHAAAVASRSGGLRIVDCRRVALKAVTMAAHVGGDDSHMQQKEVANEGKLDGSSGKAPDGSLRTFPNACSMRATKEETHVEMIDINK